MLQSPVLKVASMEASVSVSILSSSAPISVFQSMSGSVQSPSTPEVSNIQLQSAVVQGKHIKALVSSPLSSIPDAFHPA